MRWWGWGDPQHPPMLGSKALRLLRQQVGVSEQPRPPVALASVRLAPGRLPEQLRDELAGILPAGSICTDHAQRVRHAAGKGYPDLVRLRAGEPNASPDAVLYPAGPDELRAVLAACERSSVAVVPFGGGTSVVGGVEPLRGDHEAVVALDIGQMAQLGRLDRDSLTVTAGAGMRVIALERSLNDRGFTLGHFPQSYEYVSLGGCAATRSAGQSSTGYGRFEDMVEGLSLIAPTGTLTLPAFPASAAGPDLRQLVIGSEGTLGVISELNLRVRAKPEHELYEAVFFEGFHSGCEALRELAQAHTAPAVVRLSDTAETAMSLGLAGASGGLKQKLGGAYLTLRGYSAGALAVFGFHGSTEGVEQQRREVKRVARRHGGLNVGGSPGRAWAAQRFSAPYLRDELLTHGVMVETLESATHWSNLHRLHGDVSAAISSELQRMGTPGLVMCHVSHLYETGASLYFTFLARQREGAEIEQWTALKHAASQAVKQAGGTITHHHAVGRDHIPWMDAEIGEQGLRALWAMKDELDPAGIMNPGKLLAPRA
jgi:alkyldihydroxyacetonephosphate synthase